MMSKQQQRQVWQRVYHPQPPAPPVPRLGLMQCRQRLAQNLKFYESQHNHPIYGPAFAQLSRQTQEQIQMLQQIQAGDPGTPGRP